MNLSPRWVSFLTEAGWETVHWSTVGRFDAPDYELMSYASAHDYVVLTHDLDFSAILAATTEENRASFNCVQRTSASMQSDRELSRPFARQ
jgi:predicted nuclease of predicted toxin-antitoxin system